jgi:hypothetical protein
MTPQFRFGSNTVGRDSFRIVCVCLCSGGNVLTILCLSVPLFSLRRWICVVWPAKFLRRGSYSLSCWCFMINFDQDKESITIVKKLVSMRNREHT